MNTSSYHPENDCSYIETLPRFAEEERALNAVDLKLWPEIRQATRDLLGPRHENHSFLMLFNSIYRQLPRMAQTATAFPPMIGLNFGQWEPDRLQKAVLNPGYDVAHHEYNEERKQSNEQKLAQLLEQSGMKKVFERRKLLREQARMNPDVNTVLAASIELASQLPDSKVDSAMKVLSEAVDNHSGGREWRRNRTTIVSDEKNARRLTPKSLFTAEELFGNPTLGSCYNYTPLDKALAEGFKAIGKLSRDVQGIGESRGSWRFWNDIAMIRKMTYYLSLSSVRKKIDEIAAGEGGAPLREVLEAYDRSGLKAAVENTLGLDLNRGESPASGVRSI